MVLPLYVVLAYQLFVISKSPSPGCHDGWKLWYKGQAALILLRLPFVIWFHWILWKRMNPDTYAPAQQEAALNSSGEPASDMPPMLACWDCLTGLAQFVWAIMAILKVLSGSTQCAQERT